MTENKQHFQHLKNEKNATQMNPPSKKQTKNQPAKQKIKQKQQKKYA